MLWEEEVAMEGEMKTWPRDEVPFTFAMSLLPFSD